MASERDLKEVSIENALEAPPGPVEAPKPVKLSFAERKEALKYIPRDPFKCPVGKCERVLTVSELLAHGIYDHFKDFRIHKAYAGIPIFLECKISEFISGEPKCLGVIGYTGITESSMDNKDQQPGGRLICLPNQRLRGQYEALSLLLPIYVMGCKTTLAEALLPEDQDNSSAAEDRTDQDIMVFWLVGPSALKNIHASVTAFNEKRTTSVSAVVEIRESPSPQGLETIMATVNQHLILYKPDPKTVIEVIIHEFDLKFKNICI